MDMTQDVSKVDKMSQIFRYVTIERDSKGVAVAVKINKSFLGFLANTRLIGWHNSQ